MSESQLRRELKRKRPFCTAQREVVLSLLRTGDQLENRLARFFREYGLTLSQFSLLRVLQMEARPMTCGEIGERMSQRGKLFLQCFSDREPDGDGPRRVSETGLRDASKDGWRIVSINPMRFVVREDTDLNFSDGGPKAWFCAVERVMEAKDG